MRISKLSLLKFFVLTIMIGTAIITFGSANKVFAEPVTGAVFTTDSTCTATNMNIYSSKDAVYLDGGPRKIGAAGLPDGFYWVKVTEPDGTVLGVSSNAVAEVVNGEFTQCYQLSAILFKASDNSPGYDSTDNPGGEYKVWASKDGSFPPSLSKTDNFKVDDECEPNCDEPIPSPATISGIKFYDLNMDGIYQDTESLLTGWHIELYKNNVEVTETDTDADGSYQFLVDYAAGDVYTIKETLQTNWQNITPLEITVTLGPDANNNNEPILLYPDNNFGNIHLSKLGGVKYYDADQSGTYTMGDTFVSGIKINISIIKPNNETASETVYTGANGVWESSLYPDYSAYTVTETLPGLVNGTWTQTGMTKTWTGTVGDSNSLTLNFFNYCSLTPGGRTLGFWSNKNGLALVTSSDFMRLNGYNLRNANGSHRDFNEMTLDKKKSALSNWLLSASATNMAYMLSAQMTATDLSVNHSFTNPNIFVGTINGNPSTVTQFITYANGLLADPNGGSTVAASSLRTEQERVKNIFDKINNNGTFVQPTACTVAY